jgi:hypothetical protein
LFAFGVGQVSAFAARAFGDEHARAINAGRVELDEFQILQGETSAQDHRAAIAGAGMSGRRAVIGPAIAASRENDRVRFEAVDRAVFHAERDDAPAFAIFHDQIEREIFNEEVCIIFQALLIERVEHGVAGAVRRSTGALDGRAFAHILHMAAERALVDRAILIAGEGNACVFEFVNRRWGFADHIFDRVLIAEPVRALDRVIHVPGPVVGRVVAEARRDSALCCHGVGAGGEDLGDARGLQARFGAAHAGAQAGTARADDHRVIGVVDNLVAVRHQAAPPNAILKMAKSAKPPMPKVHKWSRPSVSTRMPPWT